MALDPRLQFSSRVILLEKAHYTSGGVDFGQDVVEDQLIVACSWLILALKSLLPAGGECLIALPRLLH